MRLIDADLLGLTDMEIIMCDGDYKEALKMLIDKIEHAPIIEERKWIPCSERLPEEKKDVLAVDDEGFFYIAQYSVYNKRGFWEETTEYISIDAVAWQPLPEPYKEVTT